MSNGKSKQEEMLIEKKTVSWLLENTRVETFDPVNLSGYQRKVDDKHVANIVDYIKKDGFFFPTAIICARDGDSSEDKKYRIVDGQHRIEAFKRIKEKDSEEYKKISGCYLPVVTLINPEESREIKAFIDINKKTKKVDTSLAMVLNSKLFDQDEKKTKTRLEYLTVQAAYLLNQDEAFKDSVWHDNISFEKTSKDPHIISLFAFTRFAIRIVRAFHEKKMIQIQWKSEQDFNEESKKIAEAFSTTWDYILKKKWPKVYEGDASNRRILQGAIGFSSISLYLTSKIKKDEFDKSSNDLGDIMISLIKDINQPDEFWSADGPVARFSSDTGYGAVAILLDNH